MPWSATAITQLIIQGTNDGIWIYNGAPANGNLIGSWASAAGVDPYGNPYPVGINVNQGVLTGVTLNQSGLIGGTILSTLMSASQIQGSAISGGTMTETVITFDTGGGGLFLYTTTTATTTYASNGNYTYTAPGSGPTTGYVKVWGAGASGDGGSGTAGGPGGGSGAYAAEPAYPLVGGNTYNVVVGNGGDFAITGGPGSDGGQSSFDNTGVVADGGDASTDGIAPGQGGALPTNSIAFAGNNGLAASGTTGGTGGSAPSGGTGGTGGTAGNNGGNATAPGAGGGGAGSGSGTVNISKSYRPTSTQSYYGSGVGGGLENNNGNMLQGCPNTGLNNFPGDQESFANYPTSQINSDFAGATIDTVNLEIQNLHSWYNSGMYVIFGHVNSGTNHFNDHYAWINEGALATFNLTSFWKSSIQGGGFQAMILGPSGSTGNATSLYNYGYFNGGPSYGPILKITGHTGAGSVNSGTGADGKITITATTSSVMIGGASAISQADAGGNTLAVGWTGPTTAIHPGSNPATPETWQSFPLASGWTVRSGYDSRYKIDSNNRVWIEVQVTHASTSGTVVLSTALQSGYWPQKPKDMMVGYNATAAAGANSPTAEINTSGVITLFSLPTGTTLIQLYGSYSID